MSTRSAPSSVPSSNDETKAKPGTSHFKSHSLVDTPSTEVQVETELECEPFFAHIASLPPGDIQHLRNVGLLREQRPSHANEQANEEEEEKADTTTTAEENTHIQLLRRKHAAYLSRTLYPKDVNPLPASYLSLDASKPWILYWTIHSLDLLHELPDEDEKLVPVVHTLESCWTDNKPLKAEGGGGGDGSSSTKSGGGGFGGGPHQLPHCATSYAAVNTLCILAGLEKDLYPETTSLALDLLRRKREDLALWFHSLRADISSNRCEGSATATEQDVSPCGFRMHDDGEVDVRASYTICTMASLLNVLTPDLTTGVVEYIVQCQTFEGGFGGEPYAEAHGGYTLCALGALHLLTRGDLVGSGLDVTALRGWLSRRQMGYEGGFQGRCNKLVDGCYSFWIGGSIAILDLGKETNYNSNVGTGSNGLTFDSGIFCNREVIGDESGILRSSHSITLSDESFKKEEGGLTFDQHLLQRYILLCAQDVNGGLRDKPSKPRDFYHSCYNLSGLSISQHVLTTLGLEEGENRLNVFQYEKEEHNVIGATHPVYNIRIERIQAILDSFHERED